MRSCHRAFGTAATAAALLGFAACSGDLFEGSSGDAGGDAGVNGDAAADAGAPGDAAGDGGPAVDATDGASGRYCDQPAQVGAFFCSDFDAPDASIAPDWTTIGQIVLDTAERRTAPRSMEVTAQPSGGSPVTAMAQRPVPFGAVPPVLTVAFDFRYEPSTSTMDAFGIAQLFVQGGTDGYQIAFRVVNAGAELAEFAVGNGTSPAASPQPVAMPPASTWTRVELRTTGFGTSNEKVDLSYDGVVKATLIPANHFAGTSQVGLGIIAASSLGGAHLLRFDDVVAKGN